MESTAEPEVVIEGSTSSLRSNSEVTSPARARWIVLGLAGLVAVVFGLSQWQREGPAPSNPDDGDSAIKEAATDDSDEKEKEDEPGQVEEPTGPGTAATVEPQQVLPGSGPVVGEQTGLALVISNPAVRSLRLLDLDTGTEYELASGGHPLGILDGHLLVKSEGVLSALPLDSQEGSLVRLTSSAMEWIDVVGVADGAVWVRPYVEWTGDETTIEGYDSAGNLVDERTLEDASLYLGPSAWGELSQDIGGGVYRIEGDSYRRLSQGWILAVGDELALVRECDERRQCGLNWYRIQTWESAEQLPSPELVGVGSSLTLHGNDRWLVEHSWSTNRFTVVEIATGRVVREFWQTLLDLGSETYNPFSPDGRWLVEDSASGIVIVDLDTGTEFAYESEMTGPSGNLTGVFIDRDDVGFLPETAEPGS